MLETLDEFARRVLMSLAELLKLPADAFEHVLDSGPVRCSASVLETIQYFAPAKTAINVAQSSAFTNCDAHVDRGLLTVIYSDVPSGLQVITHPQPLWSDHVHC